MSVKLSDLGHCFQGVVPSIIATCDARGEPNVTYLSQVFYVDPTHVALSCQFFNKTRRNVEENPIASIQLYDPVTFEAYKLLARYDHSETEGPLFDTMALRIQVIASHSGMAGVFRLIASDVYEVLSLERDTGFLLPADAEPDMLPVPGMEAGPLTELRGLQVVSDRIARATDLDGLVTDALLALDELFGFSHSMLLVADDPCTRLAVLASRGYGEAGLGREVRTGEGLIGTVAAERRMVRLSGMGSELRYGRAIRNRVEETGAAAALSPEVPLPGLGDAQAQLGLPLLAGERLVGVLAVESRDPLCFDEWDEAFLQIVANQIATGIERVRAVAPVTPEGATDGALTAVAAGGDAPPSLPRRRTFVFYKNDDCVFVDGEYLVRNVPGKILWKLLGLHSREGRTEFTNRELRLDPTLGLPRVKDNLESRLILLRKRLVEKCPDVRMVPLRRGRFELQVDCAPELIEKESA